MVGLAGQNGNSLQARLYLMNLIGCILMSRLHLTFVGKPGIY
jgi:hypothetical protein